MKLKNNIVMPEAWINDFCQRWKIKELSIFGSALHDGFGPASDIDILVSFREEAAWGLFEFLDMKDELEKFLGRKVDFVEKEAIRNPFRRNEISRNHEVIYAA